MREILLATGIAACVLLAQVLARLMVSPSWIAGGLVAILLGLLVSVPAAIVYHLRLYSVLVRRGVLEPRWIWHPTRFHKHLDGDERPWVFTWFFVGVAGWTVALCGCVVVALTIWLG